MTAKSSWIRSMRCAGPLTGSLRAHHWPWGLACHGVSLFAPLLYKKNKTSGANILHSNSWKVFTWKQEKPLNCKGTNSSFMQEEKCLLMQCLCPLCDKQCHNMDTGYAHPGFYTETAQLSCTKGCSCSACVKTAMVTMCRHNAHFSKLLVQH